MTPVEYRAVSGPLQLELVGLMVPGSRPRAQVEEIIVRAGEACESARWHAWRAKYDDGLHRRGRRWRRSRSLQGAAYWSDVAFSAAEALR